MRERPNRRLPALFAVAGFVLALGIYLVVDLLIALSSAPARVNFAYVGSEEGSALSFMLDHWGILLALAVALAGALLGCWVGAVAARRGRGRPGQPRP